MRSSTSSSDAGWRKSAAFAAGLFAVALLGVEAAGRSVGFVPTLDVYDRQHWADERSRVARLGSRGVVFLGRSEMVRATALDVWREELPDWEVVQLSVIGKRPGAALLDVTREPGFSGLIVCAVNDDTEFWAQDQRRWVEFHRERWNWNQRLDWSIKKALALSLVSYPTQFDPLFHVRSLVRSGRFEPPRYWEFPGDRSHFIDWNLRAWQRVLPGRREAFRQYLDWLRSPSLTSAVAWSRQALAATDPVVREFQGRGGRIVFLRLPVADLFAEPANAAALAAHKRRNWDPFAARTPAIAVHSSDEPELQGFRPRDGLHLDYREAREFSRRVVTVLRRRGALPP